jgi:carbamoyl-phosphate synthase small subunit
LEDGTLFRGLSIGASGTTVGEVVFNTAMTGYQEILTDPSYCRQIVTLTYPHIGNTGTTREDEESSRIQAAGLIVRDLPLLASNFRSEQNLSEYLTQHNTVAIADIDTRKLTRILRDGGAQSGCIMAGLAADEDEALQHARDFSGLKGMDLAKEVTTASAYEWTEGSWQLDTAASDSERLAEAPLSCGCLGLWREAQHFADPGRPGVSCHGIACSVYLRRGHGTCARRGFSIQWPR